MVDQDDPAFRGMRTGADLQALDLEPFRRFYQYWLDARGTRRMPPVSAIDPLKLPRDQLPLMMVIESDPVDGRPRIRLAGTALREATERELTGCHLDTLPNGDAIARRLHHCCTAAEPYTITADARWCGTQCRAYSALVLPFGSENGEVERLVALLHFARDDRLVAD